MIARWRMALVLVLALLNAGDLRSSVAAALRPR